MIFILLPAYNEEPNIYNLLKNIENYWLSNIKNGILKTVIVNDGSTEVTNEIVGDIKNIIKKNYNNFEIVYIKHIKNKGLEAS